MSLHGKFQDVTAAESPEEIYKGYRLALVQALGALRNNPEIVATLTTRGPHALYHLLLKKRRTASLIDQPIIKNLVRQNHLFVLPVRKTPALATFHGIGVRLYSTQRPATKEAPRVVTQFVTLVFLPLCPVAQYWAVPKPEGGWTILGQLPLRPLTELWLGIACVIGIAAILAAALYCGWAVSR